MSESSIDSRVAETVADWLVKADCAVVFTGAGVSTESGIPDFRSRGGVWTGFRTVYYDEFMASAAARQEHWQQKATLHQEFAGARPNVGHQTIAGWQSAGLACIKWQELTTFWNSTARHARSPVRTVGPTMRLIRALRISLPQIASPYATIVAVIV